LIEAISHPRLPTWLQVSSVLFLCSATKVHNDRV
jgi:hypothetical protein